MAYSEKLLKSFNEQTRKVFVPSSVTVRPEEFDVQLTKDLANVNEAQLLYVEGGLFSDCCLERPVMNLTLMPQRSLANMIPVVRRNSQVSKYAYLTSIDDSDHGPLPEFPCDDSPTPGNIDACFMEVRKGRMSRSTNTLELDAIIQRYCEGITSDLYLVGDTRGVSGLVPSGMDGNLTLMAGAAVRRQFQLVGRMLQKEALRQFWQGDPTNAARNTAGGGAREFWGMEYLIADDYDTKSFVAGTECDRLNSDVKDFENTCIGLANDTTGVGLYEYMQELEDTIMNRMTYFGHTTGEFVWVMHPTAWAAIVKHLPCEMLSGSCHNRVPGQAEMGNININVNEAGIAVLRTELRSSQRIDVNGRTYRVILDDAIPVETAGGVGNFQTTSDIYFLPLSVDGERTLFWVSADYRALAQSLQPIPGGLGALQGWHDGGLWLSVVKNENFCFKVSTKGEYGLAMTAPQLAGRINNVVACTLQSKPNWQTNEINPQ